MQYSTAFTLILFWMVNKLQCSDRVNSTAGHIAKLIVTPKPATGPIGKPIVLGREAEPLNLTCHIVYQKTERNDIPLSNETPSPVYIVDWKVFNPNDNRNLIYPGTRFERGQSENSAWLWFERLAETDAGDYTCRAVPRNAIRQPSVFTDIHLSVKNKIGTCGSKWFRCHSSRCILQRYLCDGMADCQDGEDETGVAGCGPDPCSGKVFCGERCVPRAWCCDLGNCNTSMPAVRPDPPGITSTDHQHFNDMGFLQTTIYTVIGCAMAFMFIVTILVIMICRVHMKRAMNSRCPQQVRNPGPRPRHSIPLYDLDVYLNRAADINNQGGVTVTYNINNGVQFVGRPVEPPPYSEIAPVPPREGPPPPYVSQENLLGSPIVPNPSSAVGLRVNSHSLTTQFINNEGTAARIASNYQNNQNSSSSQCFSSGQIPGPQATPGFNRFNMSLTCDDASNTTLNTSDSTALNTSSNSDSSSNDSVSNFVICRNITSHSQNFEPEYTETDSLLIENQCEGQARSADSTARNPENPYPLPHGQRANGIEEWSGIAKTNTRPDVSVLQSEYREGQNAREASNISGDNSDLKMHENVLTNQNRYEPQILKISETEPSLLDTNYEILNVTNGPKGSLTANSKEDFAIDSSCNRDVDSTLQRLSSKTVLDLSVVGESSKNNFSRINSETARSLPFYLNLNNPLRSYVGLCDADSEEHRSSLVIVNRDLIKPDPVHNALKINDPATDTDSKKYPKICTNRTDLSSDSSLENAATCTEDSPSFENENIERFPSYSNVKDDQMLRVPLVTVGDNSVSYNNLSNNLNAGDVSGDKAKTVNSGDNTSVRETQPMVMTLRESFIGVRKEE